MRTGHAIGLSILISLQNARQNVAKAALFLGRADCEISPSEEGFSAISLGFKTIKAG
jgi:hypothetical protein